MKQIKIIGSKIPAIEYDNIEECLWDRSPESKRYLQHYKRLKIVITESLLLFLNIAPA